jgi:hypothetical protein
MTNKAPLVAILLLLLASCTANAQPTLLPIISPTPTASLPPSATLTFTPTVTFTNTPLPLNTSAFDPNYIQTVTPSVPEICPASENPTQPPSITFNNSEVYLLDSERDNIILNYLNLYGMDNLLQAEIIIINPTGEAWHSPYDFPAADLTNDGMLELVDEEQFSTFILGCKRGKYQILFEIQCVSAWPGRVEEIVDSNSNGILEIAFNTGYLSQGGHAYVVYEWDGNQFQEIFGARVNATGSMVFKDTDSDGIQELIVNSGVYIWGDLAWNWGPWRNVTIIYKWNGYEYVPTQEKWDPPEYRFQAVQDGDRLFLIGEYDRALAMYLQVITSDKLKWWTPELRKYLIAINTYGATLPASPIEDRNEYRVLSAYSYFRIMLTYLVEGQETSAQGISEFIQTKYTSDPYGKAYAEMTADFWEEYSTSKSIASACQAAVSYAEGHQNEILLYLGNTTGNLFPPMFHGEQSLY